jgi:uncharacterized protein (TIRG00374 family)
VRKSLAILAADICSEQWLGYGVPQLLGKLTVILGGIGVVESTMVALYAALGVPAPIALVVVLVYRLFSFWLPTLAGIELVPYLEHHQNNIDRTEDARDGSPSAS